jgi:hypothetical protein
MHSFPSSPRPTPYPFNSPPNLFPNSSTNNGSTFPSHCCINASGPPLTVWAAVREEEID